MGLRRLRISLTIAALKLKKSVYGSAYKEKLRKNQKKSINLLRSAEVFIDKVLSLGGRLHLKLPAEHELWNDEQFKKFEESHGMCRVYFHGCAYQEAMGSQRY